MNTHVFIVDRYTFKTHLEYLFAGTGATDKKALFLKNPEATNKEIHFKTESNMVAMIADISRIRKGDNVIFYLQSYKGNPGRFYGIFKACSDPFFDENDNNNYLKEKMGKGLSFRINISPYEVYEEGITEHEFLDDINDKKHPYQLCWSLIYRKLVGRRGCTMITSYEFEDLNNKLKSLNKGKKLSGRNFSFDEDSQRIIRSNNKSEYDGRRDSLDIKQRMLIKAKRNNAFEAHLQAYIMQQYDNALKEIFEWKKDSTWVGNEVSCGVGMQSIDVMVIQDNKQDDAVHIRVVELKCVEPYDAIVKKQLPWYVRWVVQYVAPNYNKKVVIHPCIIAKDIKNTKKNKKEDIVDIIKSERIDTGIKTKTKVQVFDTEYIAFNFKNNYEDIEFFKRV